MITLRSPVELNCQRWRLLSMCVWEVTSEPRAPRHPPHMTRLPACLRNFPLGLEVRHLCRTGLAHVWTTHAAIVVCARVQMLAIGMLFPMIWFAETGGVTAVKFNFSYLAAFTCMYAIVKAWSFVWAHLALKAEGATTLIWRQRCSTFPWQRTGGWSQGFYRSDQTRERDFLENIEFWSNLMKNIILGMCFL